MGYIVLGIVIINTIISIVFAITMHNKGQKAGLALFFFVFPVMGFLVYLIPLLILRLRGVGSYDRESLVKRMEVKQESVMPIVEKELNVIPIEDAMAISSNVEKRTLLLEQLKKDISVNYKTVLVAGNDSDSESAHYVAAAKMEVDRRKQSQVSGYKKEWEADKGNYEKLILYLEALSEYISSELLAEKEADIYKIDYCQKVNELLQKKKDMLKSKEYGCCLEYLIELGQDDMAESLWEHIPEECKSERNYLAMLKKYYTDVNKEMFYKYLDELSSSKIELSSEGLRMLRYWRERRL